MEKRKQELYDIIKKCEDELNDIELKELIKNTDENDDYETVYVVYYFNINNNCPKESKIYILSVHTNERDAIEQCKNVYISFGEHTEGLYMYMRSKYFDVTYKKLKLNAPVTSLSVGEL